MQRVKVYKLNEDGLWDDKGTGHVSVEYMEVCVRGAASYHIAAGAGPGCSWRGVVCASGPARLTRPLPSLRPEQKSDSVGLVVIGEENTSTLLIHRITRDTAYQRQGGASLAAPGEEWHALRVPASGGGPCAGRPPGL